MEIGYIDTTGSFIYLELSNLNQQDIIIEDQQNPGSTVQILNVLNQNGTYKTHFILPSGGVINVLITRDGYAPWTEDIPASALIFVREINTSLSAITGQNQQLTVDLLIKLLQRTEAVSNVVNLASLPLPTVNVTTNTTSSTTPPSVENQEAELLLLRRILLKVTANREAIKE